MYKSVRLFFFYFSCKFYTVTTYIKYGPEYLPFKVKQTAIVDCLALIFMRVRYWLASRYRVLLLLLLFDCLIVVINPFWLSTHSNLYDWSEPVTRLSITLQCSPFVSSPEKLLSIIKQFIPIFLSLFFTWIYDNFQ